VSGLPPFLAEIGGTRSGFMIAQYTAASLVAQNRRIAAPASLDGGVTSGLQEDHLCHATPAALKALDIIENSARILGIELLAATQACDLQPTHLARAPYTEALRTRVRDVLPIYRDDRPLANDMMFAFRMISDGVPPPLPGPLVETDRTEASAPSGHGLTAQHCVDSANDSLAEVQSTVQSG
jgi:histidine ammonia-lyase